MTRVMQGRIGEEPLVFAGSTEDLRYVGLLFQKDELFVAKVCQPHMLAG